jgi:hypothetical protein
VNNSKRKRAQPNTNGVYAQVATFANLLAQGSWCGTDGPNLPFMAGVENDRSRPLSDIGQVALIILLFLEAGIAALSGGKAKTFRRVSLEI